jgi:rubrerythrin
MIIHTASEGITLARKLENESAQFYEGLAKKYTPDAETLLSFARENRKNIVQIDRAYYGVITDALEGGYAFNLDTESYVLKATIPEKAKYADVLKQAAAMEEKIIAYYTAAAEQSRALMADVPQTFLLVAKKRKNRKEKLQELLDREGGK